VWVRWTPAPAGAVTPPEVGYAVGRAAGTAVARNRVKRRLRAAVDSLAVDMKPGLYLLGGGPDVATTPFTELREALRSCLTRAGALQ
jgi:ribonuclease P protein component